MHRTEVRERLRALWRHGRVLFIAFHVVAVVVMSLPSPGSLQSRPAWETQSNQDALEVWAHRLSFLGYDSKEELDADLWSLAQQYVKLRAGVIRPFELYGRYTGTFQGWRMFALPQRYPVEFQIDILEPGTGWRPIYRPDSDEHDFWGDNFRHNRVRKLIGRFGRAYASTGYDAVTRYLAGVIFAAYPTASEVRFRLYRYPRRTPAEVRAGKEVVGRYEMGRSYRAAEFPAGTTPVSPGGASPSPSPSPSPSSPPSSPPSSSPSSPPSSSPSPSESRPEPRAGEEGEL